MHNQLIRSGSVDLKISWLSVSKVIILHNQLISSKYPNIHAADKKYEYLQSATKSHHVLYIWNTLAAIDENGKGSFEQYVKLMA